MNIIVAVFAALAFHLVGYFAGYRCAMVGGQPEERYDP
jgi:hypothetical protein